VRESSELFRNGGLLSAPPGQEGLPTTSRDIAKHPKSREAGWWFKDSLSLNHHPVCAVIGGFAAFSHGASCPCYVGSGQGQSQLFVSSNDTAASKRIDTNVLSVAILLPQRSPYCSGMGPSPEPLRAPFRIFRSQITCRTRATNPSTTSNLLFGNLQHPYQVYSWVPVHVSAGDGLNSWPGD